MARSHRTRLAALLLLFLLVAGLAGSAAFWAYREAGRTPSELLDYAERRMEGHPKVEWLGLPLASALRDGLGISAAAERARQPFFVPAPPQRRGPGEVGATDPIPLGARVWRVGPQGPLLRIADAARLAKDGDVVEIEAGDYRGDVALWNQSKLTIRGINGAARLYADGQSAEGKAIWVIRNGAFDIANIDFIGARVQDGNGAGIRFEGGDLRLRHCLFWGNQFGLLTSGSDRALRSSLTIEGSEFAFSHVQGRWAHNLYVGTIETLTVTGSYFHHADTGHLLKSRARVNHILYNRFTDESGGRASYELNFPNGGFVRLVGNVVQQQAETENSAMLAYGEEGYRWPDNQLLMGNNTMVNDHPHGGRFVAVAPGAVRVVTANNLWIGSGALHVPEGLSQFNDHQGGWDLLARPSRQDYRLREESSARMAFRAMPDTALASMLTPLAQYIHPREVRAINAAPQVVGADQRRMRESGAPGR